MVLAAPGASICLFCSSREIFRSQLNLLYKQSRNTRGRVCQYATEAQSVGKTPRSTFRILYGRSRLSPEHDTEEGRERVGITKKGLNLVQYGKTRADDYTGPPFRKKRTFYGGHEGDLDSDKLSLIRRQTSGRESIEQATRRLLTKMYNQINDRIFRLGIGLVGDDGEDKFLDFERAVLRLLDTNSHTPARAKAKSALIDAFDSRGGSGLESQLKFLLQTKLANEGFQQADILNQLKVADIRYPAEWYPHARKVKRTIHLHIGPTNSGKTYHALKRLEDAKRGCYAGPLRLLAHEVYTRLNAKGKTCNLITGDEITIEDGVKETLSSCTVEMVPFGEELDVAVIDEIQMIGDEERGWAWTQALLGLRAREVHLCGETRTLPLIQDIAASLGEQLIVHNYERLSPLKVATDGLGGQLENLQKGDCVISFSRKALHALKQQIESKTGKDVAIVYGALPPEIRAHQAKLFNDQDNTYDILVASDAVGMGLNLSIKRIVFEALDKFNGNHAVPLAVPQIKQIGGRAGRYRTASAAVAVASSGALPEQPTENVGYVTTFHNADLSRLQIAMTQEPEGMKAAGLKVPDSLIRRFASYFPSTTPFSYILLRLQEISRLSPHYFLCDLTSQIEIADAIQQVPDLSVRERMVFCHSPGETRNPHLKKVLIALAECVAERKSSSILDIPALGLDILDAPLPPALKSQEYIMAVATAHQAIVLYIWLSYRLSTIFQSQALAFHTKNLLQAKLDEALSRMGANEHYLARRREALERAEQSVDPDLVGESAMQGTMGSAAVDDDGIQLVDALKDEFKQDAIAAVEDKEDETIRNAVSSAN